MIFQYNKRWQKQYSDLAVHMQILHFPMVLWYLGGRYHSILSNASLRSLCVLLFRPSWILSVSFRFSSMAMATVNSLRLLDGLILAALTCVYFLLDLYWSSCFFGRVGPSHVPLTLISSSCGIILAILASKHKRSLQRSSS
mmetsp:Transcript_31013/g.99484  ORF Transcript_31013/g.99484 Transcript_31013/m.99484 type:complete len:141 (-) Transcript_31013:315-737(-)